MPLSCRRALSLFVVLAVAGALGCFSYRDPCANVACQDGAVCIALEQGTRCVCDDAHEEVVDDDGASQCVPLEGDGEGEE